MFLSTELNNKHFLLTICPASLLLLLLMPFSGHASISLVQAFSDESLRGRLNAIGVLSDNSLIILNSDHGYITKLTAKGVEKRLIVGPNGLFKSGRVAGLAVIPGDELVFSNSSEGRLAVSRADGGLKTHIGESGSRRGAIDEPSGLAYSINQRIYVADQNNDRISVFGADGVFLHTLGQHGLPENQRLSSPSGVHVDASERVYVFETGNQGRLSVFSSKGKLLTQLSIQQLNKISGVNASFSAMAIDDTGLVYLADNANGRIFQIDWQKQVRLNAFGSKGDERGQFRDISGLAVLSDNRVAVVDSGNHKVEIFQLADLGRQTLQQKRLPTVLRYTAVPADCQQAYRLRNGKTLCLENDSVSLLGFRGELIKKLTGTFSRLRAANSDESAFLVLDNDRIKLYSLEGEAKFSGKGFAGSGSGEGKLDTARGVYLKGDKIYVADSGNRRLQVFSRDGIYLDKLTNPQNSETVYFSEPMAVTVDAQDNIYIADSDYRHVLVFSPQMKLLYKLGGNGDKQNVFERIYDIAMDTDNNLYVLCATPVDRYSIQVYRGPKKVMSFGAYSETLSGIEQAANLSVAKSKKTIVSIYDTDKQALLNLSYLQVPAKVSGIEVVGGLNETQIKWLPVPGSFIAGYNIYGSRHEARDYKFLSRIVGSTTKIRHKHKPALYYKVSASSGLAREGGISRPHMDGFRIAYDLYMAKKYQQAVVKLDGLLQLNPQQADALKVIGLSLYELGEFDKAIKYFQVLSAIKGHEFVGMNLQIKGLVAAKQLIEAKAVLDKLMASNSVELDTFVYCGELSLKLGDPIAAVTCLEKVLNANAEHIEAHLLMGQAYLALGITDKGLAEFVRAAEIAPGNADVWYRSGQVMQSMKKHDKAIEYFKKALAINAKHTSSMLGIAESYLLTGKYQQVKNMAISLAGDPATAAQGHYLLGLVAIEKNNSGEALLALTKSTRLMAENEAAWLALVDVYQDLKQKEKIYKVLVDGCQAMPGSFKLAYRLGQLELRAKRYKKASVHLARAVKAKPDFFDARYAMAVALAKQDDFKMAMVQAQHAVRLKPDEVSVYVLLSELSGRQGKIGKSIEYIKLAMDKAPNRSELHSALGRLYMENNLYAQAQKQLEKAVLLDKRQATPHLILGQLFIKRRLFDDAIAAYDKAVSLKPSAENKLLLDTAYAEKKKTLDFKSNAPRVVLKDLQLNQVFSAAYKQYTEKPVGRIRLKNASGVDYGNLKLSFTIKGYMDFPSSIEVTTLAANSTQEIELFATFNNKILEIDEDTGVQVEVALNFVRDGRQDAIKLTQPMTIYGKNAILWGEPNMVGAFVTPKDDTLRDFVRQAINENKPQAGPLNEQLVTAMTLFDVLSAHGIRYVVDPNSPYSKVETDRVDYVQFARETLKIKSGDCDDLSVLLSAGLENLGIQTAIVDVPGHLMMMFNTGLSVQQRDRISLHDELLVVRDQQIWLPIEATMIGTSFAEAWAEGARKYFKYERQGQAIVVPLQQAWERYLPVTLKPAAYTIAMPLKDKVSALVDREQKILLQKSLDRLVKPYEILAASKPADVSAKMQVAIIYAKYGLHSRAHKMFDSILKQQPENSAVHNNRGNIYFASGEYQRAVEAYIYAEQLSTNDPGIKVNLAMAYYQLGQLDYAQDKFHEARIINKGVEQQYAGLASVLSQ